MNRLEKIEKILWSVLLFVVCVLCVCTSFAICYVVLTDYKKEVVCECPKVEAPNKTGSLLRPTPEEEARRKRSEESFKRLQAIHKLPPDPSLEVPVPPL